MDPSGNMMSLHTLPHKKEYVLFLDTSMRQTCSVNCPLDIPELKDQGIEVRFVDPIDPNAFKNASDNKTRAYFGETLPNPKLNIFPITEVSEIGKHLGIPLIIDNTAAPYICKPFLHGASIIVHSTTKYIGGQGSAIGGIIVDSGKFDWGKDPKRQPNLNDPDPSYHGMVWTEFAKAVGPIAYIVRARFVGLRDIGAALSPQSAFNIIQGLETVSLRMEKHCSNAAKVAEYLSSHNKVSRVIYAGLDEGEAGERANKYLKGGHGALCGIELKGGKASGEKFINNLNMFYHVANIGDARSLAIHPASTTHSQLSDEEMESAGVTPSYVRLSIGIEHIDDIIEDLKNALDAA